MALKSIDLVSKSTQGNLEVGWCIGGFKSTKHTSVLRRVGVGKVYNLEAHLETTPTLVTPNLDPDLRLRDDSIVPGELS